MENPDITLEESKKVLLQYLKRRTYSWYTPGSEMKKNYLAGGQQPSGLARTLAALGFPSEDFQAKVVSNAPWMLWAQEEP